jgi:phosphoserine aminotransferase
MSRAHNFSAGPAVLPLSVIEELQAALPEFGGTRQGLMELSHRSQAFDDVIESAKARMRRLMSIPDDYEILLLQGGASLQFYMATLNLTGPEDAVDFIDTGTWSSKAVKEAARVCKAETRWSSKSDHYTRVPHSTEDLNTRDDALFVHYTTNNTIYGTQYHHLPATSARLVADLSSDICSRPIDVSRHDLLYAGAQKNLGPSGVTAVILSPWAQDRSRKVGATRSGGLPSMLDYGLMIDKGSLFNTPNTFGIYALERVLAWLEGLGGVDAMAAINTRKSARLYTELDRTEFWQPHAQKNSRSEMNITWRLADDSLVPVFLEEAANAGLVALKGHRSVGGLRASIYNSCPEQSVNALADFMAEFERRNG